MLAPSIRRFQVFVVVTTLLATMFLPMVVIHLYGAQATAEGSAPAGEITVGIAVILRATARRLLRGASTNFLRTTAGAFGRTSARAATRRFVKFSSRLFFGSFVQQSVDGERHQERADRHTKLPRQALALGLGFGGLCLSFFGILSMLSADARAGLLGSRDFDTTTAVLLAGAPLLAYVCLHQGLGRIFGVRARYRTEIDGLLLQGYFTGAGSFLPLTTDVDYVGSDSAKRNLAIGSLLGMLGLYQVSSWAAATSGSVELAFLAPMFLVYAFVYCFPIKPLEGHFIWSSSKLLWLIVAAPIVGAFILRLPDAFGEIL